jgi:hypothetical protein
MILLLIRVKKVLRTRATTADNQSIRLSISAICY